jgi:hypothetical protein
LPRRRQSSLIPPHPALGLACYQEAELHRLRGELDVAADAYGRPNRSGFPPMPGLALLNLVRGEVAAATAGIRRALGEAGQPFQRPSLLAAAAEIFVAAGDVPAADDAAGELASIAAQSSSQVLGAMAEQARGSVLSAAGEAGAALAPLGAECGSGCACPTRRRGQWCCLGEAVWPWVIARRPSSTTPARRSPRSVLSPTWLRCMR